MTVGFELTPVEGVPRTEGTLKPPTYGRKVRMACCILLCLIILVSCKVGELD